MSKVKMLALAGLVLGNSLYAGEEHAVPEAPTVDMFKDTSSLQPVDFSACQNWNLWKCVQNVGRRTVFVGLAGLFLGMIPLRRELTDYGSIEYEFFGRKISGSLYRVMKYITIVGGGALWASGFGAMFIGDNRINHIRKAFLKFIHLDNNGNVQRSFYVIQDDQGRIIGWASKGQGNEVFIDVLRSPNNIDLAFTNKIKELFGLQKDQNVQWNIWTKVNTIEENAFDETDSVLFNQISGIAVNNVKLHEVILRKGTKIKASKFGLKNENPDNVNVKGNTAAFQIFKTQLQDK